MANDAPVLRAADTAWTVYLSLDREINAVDRRRSLLERHLHRQPRDSDPEDLTRITLAYLQRLSEDQC